MLTITGPLTEQHVLAERILRALPDWFGIEEAVREYVTQARTQPTFVATLDGEGVGFLTLKQHSPDAAEISVMGVLPTVHRQGVGRALVSAAEAYLRDRHVRFLQVKTLSPRHPDPGYAQTRRFYEAVGFCRLEEHPTLWGKANPCLQLIKVLM